jgi:hypothetical protein
MPRALEFHNKIHRILYGLPKSIWIRMAQSGKYSRSSNFQFLLSLSGDARLAALRNSSLSAAKRKVLHV